MSSTTIVVIGMCILMMGAGVLIIRISHRDRGMGAIFVAVGIVGVLAFVSAEDGAPPSSGSTPIATESRTPNIATPSFRVTP